MYAAAQRSEDFPHIADVAEPRAIPQDGLSLCQDGSGHDGQRRVFCVLHRPFALQAFSAPNPQGVHISTSVKHRMTHPMRCREMCESAAGVSPMHPDQGDALDPPLTAQCAVDHELVKGKALDCGVWGRKDPNVFMHDGKC